MPGLSTKTTRLSPEKTLELWRTYKASGDRRVRDRLVLTFTPMIKYIVYKKLRDTPARSDVEDFISCGLEALIRSIDRFDPDKGGTLEQFAWTRIHGAVLDELRRNDWAPRSLRRWERDINRARDQFFALNGRTPSTAELSESLGVDARDLLRREADIARSEVGSLNTPVLGEDDTTIERLDTVACSDRFVDPDHMAMTDGAKRRFRAEFARLSDRDRKVAVLLYVHDLTLREIGEILGVTESRVCQIHGQLKRTLRVQLRADEQLLREVA
jgi:RNA polymerase sigma factor for flagellar operon FliA